MSARRSLLVWVAVGAAIGATAAVVRLVTLDPADAALQYQHSQSTVLACAGVHADDARAVLLPQAPLGGVEVTVGDHTAVAAIAADRIEARTLEAWAASLAPSPELRELVGSIDNVAWWPTDSSRVAVDALVGCLR